VGEHRIGSSEWDFRYSVFATPYFATRLKMPAPGSVFAVLAEQNQNHDNAGPCCGAA
jgi:hypothetical protein